MRSQSRYMPPKPIVDLDDADDGLYNSEDLFSTSAEGSSPMPLLDETYSGRKYGIIVPSRNIQ